MSSIKRLNGWISGVLMMGLACLQSFDAQANVMLKKFEVTQGNGLSLSFDGKLESSKISTEYFNDIIQVSLGATSVYPARVKSFTEGPIAKVFIYQYSPKMVRCRITVRGKADAFKSRFHLKNLGRSLSLRVGSLVGVSVQDLSSNLPSSAEAARAVTEPHLDEQGAEVSTQKTLSEAEIKLESSAEQSHGLKTLGGSKPLPAFSGLVVKLGLVILIFGMCAFLLRKMLGARKQDVVGSSGIMQAIGRVAGGQWGPKDKLIEVLSTQYLGPKKSISVVKVAGRTLVLGLSQDSIHLITQFPSSPDAQDAADEAELVGLSPADAQGQVSFSDLLQEEKPSPIPLGSQGARSRIKSRLEGLKPL
jgi:flagellar biogenesis protein FliO